MVSRVYEQTLHKAVIDRLTAHFREVRLKLHTNAQIVIRFAWRCHKQRKRIKLEKKKAAAAAKKAKKGKFGTSRARAGSTATAPPAAKPSAPAASTA